MIEWIISSSVLIAVVIALRYLLKGKISLRLQYALWGLVLLRLLIPFSIGSSGFSVMNTLEKAPVVQDAKSVSGVESIERKADGVVQGFISSDYSHDFPTVVAEHKTEQEFARMKTVLDVRTILKPLWLGGTAVLLVVFAASNGRFAYRLRRTRKPLEVKGSVLPVYVTHAVVTPCLFGLFSPAIYLPPEAAEDATVFRHTVEHETTHFRHGDNFWAVLRGVCLALHWYNPLVWWAAVLSRNDAELSCDEATIRRIGEGERAEYGRTLIRMTCQKRPALLTAATTMTGSKSSIRERITLIARKPKMASYTLIAVVLIAAVAAGCTFTGAKNGGSANDEDVTLYDCGGLTVAIPNEYVDQLVVQTGAELENDAALISVYEKASREAAAADGMDDPDFGWMFSLVRYDQAQHEQRVASPGLFFFAKDDEWYYGYRTSTVEPFEDIGTWVAALTQWDILSGKLGPLVRDDFMERNGLTPYSDIAIAGGDQPTIPQDLPSDIEYLYDFRFSERYGSRVTPDFSFASLGSTVALDGTLSLFEIYREVSEAENESVYDGDGMVPYLYKWYRYALQQGTLIIGTDYYEPDNVEYISYLWTDLKGVQTNRAIAVGSSEAELLQAYTSDLYFLEQGDTEPSVLAMNEEPNVGVCDYAYAWQPFTQESNEVRDITFYIKDGVVAAIEIMEPYELRYVYGYDRAAGLEYADARRLEVGGPDVYEEAERVIESYMNDIESTYGGEYHAGYSIDSMEQVGDHILAVVQYDPNMGEGSLYLLILGNEDGKLAVTDEIKGNLPMSMGVELYKAAFSGKTVLFGAVTDQLWFDPDSAPQKVDFTEIKALCSNGTERSVPVSNDQAFLMCMDGDVYVDEVLFLSGSEVAGKLSELPFGNPIEKLNTQGRLY